MAAPPDDDPRRTGRWPDTVLHRQARQGSPRHVAPLSLHTVFAGREVYHTDLGRHAVEPGRYLLLNEGQSAATFVAPGQRVESFSALFSRALACDVRRALTARDEQLLDDPGDALSPPDVLEHTYPLTGDLAGLIARLSDRAGDPGARDEALHDLLAALLVAQRQARTEAERVPARRASTRVELLRRLWRARDFLDATLDAAVPLARLGREAGLSPHRLLRLYQATFGETPHRYHVRRRLERAHGLLRAGTPVGEAARAVGFESAASFGTLFRSRYGCSPRQVRGRR